VLIVNYHAIGPERSPITCTLDELRSDIRGLRDAGFEFVTLDDCADWLEAAKPLPSRPVAITFDDGYASVARQAVPFLAAERVPCAVFVIAGRLGADNQWPGQWKSVPALPLIDRAALLELSTAGVCIGAHTFTHPVLPSLDAPAAFREIVDAPSELEEIVGRPVRHFAYPYGLKGAREAALAGERYRLALSTTPALVSRTSDRVDVPRVDCHDVRIALRFGLTGGAVFAPYLRARAALRRGRRIVARNS
jgi:peptidoglycan/xylan/chitin deacetylase (PgdA/CDA1 family)